MEQHDQFYQFMQAHNLTVMSSIGPDGRPQAAVIGFGQNTELEIIFGTDNSSRKYQNITVRPEVAFVIGWQNSQTMQYEGICRELRSEELHLVRDNYWKKNPEAERHNENASERYFIVKPTWIRHTDMNSQPWKIQELRF